MGCSSSRGAEAGFVNKLLFPAPEPSSYADWNFKGELLWVPLAQYCPNEGLAATFKDDDYAFPCRLLQAGTAAYLIIFFHKNADDLGSCRPFVEKLHKELGVHMLVVEYPGYGLCSSRSVSAERVNRHAHAALEFVQRALGVPLRRIILLGACLGTGPAAAVAAEWEVGGVVLVSPFLSVCQMFRGHVGALARLVTEQFPNDALVPRIRSPTLICHGQQDTMVPFSHAEQLYNSLTCEAKKLVKPRRAGHQTNMLEDERNLVAPMRDFFGLPGDPCPDGLRVPTWVFQKRRQRDELLLAQDSAVAAGAATPAPEAQGAAPLVASTCAGAREEHSGIDAREPRQAALAPADRPPPHGLLAHALRQGGLWCGCAFAPEALLRLSRRRSNSADSKNGAGL